MRLACKVSAVTSVVVAALGFYACRTLDATVPAPESTLNEAGFDTVSSCTPTRKIDDPREGLDFSARALSLPDAYWMALLAGDAYAKKEVLIPELKRLGFTDAFFFDEDGVARNVFNTGYDFPWASTQGFWAESPNGIVISFRGSVPTALADIVSDAWSSQSKLEGMGSQAIGTISDAAAAASIALPGGSVDLEKGREILVHAGFWNALQIVWKHLEAKAKQVYAVEHPKERVTKMALLDSWARIYMTQGDAAARAAAEKEADWRIDGSAKLKFVKLWTQQKTEKQRVDLYEFLDANWVPKTKPIFVTGHSLGGGLATLAAYRLMKLGLNVQGLYTYGGPRVGNQAFVHDFRVLSWYRGLKAKGTSHGKGDGGLQRFVNHYDVITRIPPSFGWNSAFHSDADAEEASAWAHASSMNYLTGPETPTQELWIEDDDSYDAKFAQSPVPRFVVSLPLERWKEWGTDHMSVPYISKLERLAFGKATPCL